VIAQGAISVVLLSAAALLGQSLRNLEHQNFGFETEGRYVVSINPVLGGYKAEQMEPLLRQINDRLRQIPGVRMVTEVLYAPMSGDSWNEGIRVEGRPEPAPKEDTGSGFARVMPDFFDALGSKIVLGRPITEEDTATTRKVAVINEAFAKKFFKDQNPIGQHFGPNKIKYSSTYEIVGVVKDIRYMTWGMKEPVRPMYWLPEAQFVQWDDPAWVGGEMSSHYLGNIVLWAPGNPPGMQDRVRKTLASVDPNLVLYSVDPYQQVVSGQFQQEKMIATLTSLFGVLGLILASVGLYGVLSYMVEQRTSEIGVRMALGAQRGDVLKLILKQGILLAATGVIVGLAGSFGLTRVIATLLFDVPATDKTTFAAVAVGLFAITFLASYIPAWRATKVDPLTALRYE
jgi:predicted permease